MSVEELEAAAAGIRARRRQLRTECRSNGLFYLDVAEAGFETAIHQARQALLG